MMKFKRGELNVLVATCIAEEGLDIGEVDLIICYDSGFSPIRMIQRMGRTGRKRDGKIIILLSEGKELRDYERFLKEGKKIKN
jgi:ERCC4-related helicase